MGQWLAWVVGTGALWLVSACGSDESEKPECVGTDCDATGGSSGGPAAGAPAAGSPARGGSGSGGSSGGAGDAGASGAATTSTGGVAGERNCEGAFGPSSPVFLVGDHPIASLSVTGDELELFFVDIQPNAQGYPISVLRRASKDEAFPTQAEHVPELQVACAPENYPTLDVTDDGLRMYITCLDGSSPLRVATRTSRTASWNVTDEPAGTVADSIGVSDDELAAVAVVDLIEAPRPVLYLRASREQPFGSAQSIPGISSGFRNPDLVDGGRLLFGVLTTAGSDRIGASTRTGAGPTDYSAPTTTDMPAPAASLAASTHDYTPTVTADCRGMYFLRELRLEVGAQWTIEVSRR